MSSPDPAASEQPYQSPSQRSLDEPDTARLAYAIAWTVFVLFAGGALASYIAQEFDHLGLLAVWPIGWAGGVVAHKILGGKSRLVGGLLVATCFLICAFTMIAWIRAEIVDAEDSWTKAITLLPVFFRQYKIFTIVTVIVFISAAAAAWREVAVRYVRVRVE